MVEVDAFDSSTLSTLSTITYTMQFFVLMMGAWTLHYLLILVELNRVEYSTVW